MLKFLEDRLKHYHNKVIVQFLRYGWPVGAIGDFPNIPPFHNHKSTVQFPDEMYKYIRKGLQNGTLFGPFQNNTFGCNIVVNHMESGEV